VTEEEERALSNGSGDARKRPSSIASERRRLSRQFESRLPDRELDSENVVRPKDPTIKSSSDKSPTENEGADSNSLVNRESSARDSHSAITRTERSQHQTDRRLAAFIR